MVLYPEPLTPWQYKIAKDYFNEHVAAELDAWLAEMNARHAKMNPCLVTGCTKMDADKPMAFRGEPYCSEQHRKVMAGELKLEMVPTVVEVKDVPKEVVE